MHTMRSLILGFWDDVEQSLKQPLPSLIGKLPSEAVQHLIFCGMGGSGMAGGLMARLAGIYQKSQATPLFTTLCKEYDLPPCHPSQTLVFLSSYSGNTEETLSCARQAAKRGFTCVVFTSGGKLQSLAAEKGWPCLSLPPGRPPRSCLGFSWILQMRMLTQSGLFDGAWENLLKEALPRFRQQQKTMDEDAREAAFHLKNKCLVIVADEALYPVAERWMQQLSENSKAYTHISLVPEMNHNELVAWRNLPDSAHVIFLEHERMHPRTVLRYEFLRGQLAGRRPFSRFISREENLMADYLYLIHLGDLLSAHLATQNGYDAMEIAVIDNLKRFLDERA